MNTYAQIIIAAGITVFLILFGSGICSYMVDSGQSLREPIRDKIERYNKIAIDNIEEVHFSNGKSFNLVTSIIDGSEIKDGSCGCKYKVSKAMGVVFKIEILDTSCPDKKIGWEPKGETK